MSLIEFGSPTPPTAAPSVPLVNGYGANLSGGPSSGPPTSGTWIAGTVVTDGAGYVWTCTASGTPGTWVTNGGKVVLDKVINTVGFTVSTSATVDLTGMVINPVVPTGRAIKLVFDCDVQTGAAMHGHIQIQEGSTVLLNAAIYCGTAFGIEPFHREIHIVAPSSGSHTYKLTSYVQTNGTNFAITGAATDPFQFWAELS